MSRHVLTSGAVLLSLAALALAGPSWARKHKPKHPAAEEAPPPAGVVPPNVRAPALNGRLNGPIGAYTTRSGNNTIGELPMPPTGRPPTSPASPGSGDPTPTDSNSFPDTPPK